MMPRRLLLVLTGLSLLVVLAVGCSKPKPPTLTPRSAQVTALKPDGVQLSLLLGAHNPNGFPIVVNSVAGIFELQDGTPLGTGSSAAAFTIPSEGDQDLPVTLDVRFSSLSVLAPYALAAKPLPYRIRGNARIGSDNLNIDVPYTIEGQLTAEQVMAASLRGAANLLAPHTP
jgi:LEA14-like dessication related protein